MMSISLLVLQIINRPLTDRLYISHLSLFEQLIGFLPKEGYSKITNEFKTKAKHKHIELHLSEHKGETGIVKTQVFIMGDIGIRKVEYSAGYKADHWCSKGHIILCTDGEMETELEDGRIMELTAGMTYFIGDDCEAHRSSTQSGCKLYIVD